MSASRDRGVTHFVHLAAYQRRSQLVERGGRGVRAPRLAPAALAQRVRRRTNVTTDAINKIACIYVCSLKRIINNLQQFMKMTVIEVIFEYKVALLFSSDHAIIYSEVRLFELSFWPKRDVNVHRYSLKVWI